MESRGTLFIFSESGWNEMISFQGIFQVEKETEQADQMVKIWYGCFQFFLLE